MSNDLVPSDLSKSAYATPAALETVSRGGGDYLPRIQVMGGNSDLVKRGQFPIGNFALFQGKTPVSLGKEFNCVLISMRPKAMRFDPIMSVYDTTLPEFKELQEKAEADSQSGCAYGPEYLLWLTDFSKFATLFLGNKSGRGESGKVQGFMSKACTFKCEFVENKRKQGWHLATVNDYAGGDIVMPETERMIATANKFNAPPPIEKQEEAEAATSNRAR